MRRYEIERILLSIRGCSSLLPGRSAGPFGAPLSGAAAAQAASGGRCLVASPFMRQVGTAVQSRAARDVYICRRSCHSVRAGGEPPSAASPRPRHVRQARLGERRLAASASTAACGAPQPPPALCRSSSRAAPLLPWAARGQGGAWQRHAADARGLSVAARAAKRGSRGGGAAAAEPPAVAEEKIEERELHAEASEAYLSVRPV